MNEQELNHFLEFKSIGLRLLREKKYLESLSTLEEALRLSPNDLELLFYEAICLYYLNNLERASDLVEKLYEMDVENIIAGLPKVCCIILLKAGKTQKAKKLVKDNLTKYPDDPQFLNMLGYSYQKEGRYKEAEKIYRSILEKEKENTNACNSMAYVLVKQEKNLEEAFDLIKIAIKKEPGNPAYLDTEAMVLAAQGKTEDAIEKLKIALKYAPDSKEILRHLAKLIENKKTSAIAVW